MAKTAVAGLNMKLVEIAMAYQRVGCCALRRDWAWPMP